MCGIWQLINEFIQLRALNLACRMCTTRDKQEKCTLQFKAEGNGHATGRRAFGLRNKTCAWQHHCEVHVGQDKDLPDHG